MSRVAGKCNPINRHEFRPLARSGKNPDDTPNKFRKALNDFARSGPIGLQGLHGKAQAPVYYRNLKIKVLGRVTEGSPGARRLDFLKFRPACELFLQRAFFYFDQREVIAHVGTEFHKCLWLVEFRFHRGDFGFQGGDLVF